MVALDADGQVMLINKKGCEILGYRKEEILGRNWFGSFLPETFGEEVYSIYKQLMAGQIEPVEHYENSVLTRSGEERIISWHNSVLTAVQERAD